MLNSVSFRWTALSAVALIGAGCLGTDQDPDNGGTTVDSVTFRSVDAGGAHTCGVVVGDLGCCWGNNTVGQLGSGDNLNHSIPVVVSQGSVAFAQISAGGTFACAISDEQDAYCWGQNQFGQIGIGTSNSPPVVTPQPVLGGHKFVAISVGGVHVCALTATGQAWCWGQPGLGQLGNSVTGDTPQPVPDSVHGGLRFREVQAATFHTCGVTSSGEAYCWGQNTNGELGTGTTQNSDVPIAVIGGILFDAVDTGDEHTCGFTLDGDAYCWGRGQDGQLGTGDRANSNEPVLVVGGLAFNAISAGGRFTCGVAGVDAYCWGLNARGELGDGTSITRTEPTAVLGNLQFETISTGEGGLTTHTCGFTSDSKVYCWGEGLDGQLGTGSTSSSTAPVLVVGQR
jgi:alpha-tubulin suppressor-like RCC1 family protein